MWYCPSCRVRFSVETVEAHLVENHFPPVSNDEAYHAARQKYACGVCSFSARDFDGIARHCIQFTDHKVNRIRSLRQQSTNNSDSFQNYQLKLLDALQAVVDINNKYNDNGETTSITDGVSYNNNEEEDFTVTKTKNMDGLQKLKSGAPKLSGHPVKGWLSEPQILSKASSTYDDSIQFSSSSSTDDNGTINFSSSSLNDTTGCCRYETFPGEENQINKQLTSATAFSGGLQETATAGAQKKRLKRPGIDTQNESVQPGVERSMTETTSKRQRKLSEKSTESLGILLLNQDDSSSSENDERRNGGESRLIQSEETVDNLTKDQSASGVSFSSENSRTINQNRTRQEAFADDSISETTPIGHQLDRSMNDGHFDEGNLSLSSEDSLFSGTPIRAIEYRTVSTKGSIGEVDSINSISQSFQIARLPDDPWSWPREGTAESVGLVTHTRGNSICLVYRNRAFLQCKERPDDEQMVLWRCLKNSNKCRGRIIMNREYRFVRQYRPHTDEFCTPERENCQIRVIVQAMLDHIRRVDVPVRLVYDLVAANASEFLNSGIYSQLPPFRSLRTQLQNARSERWGTH